MTNFEMNLSLFKIAAYTAIGGTDPERQLAIFGEAPENVASVSLGEMFQAGPILDHGKVHPMDKLLKSFGLGDNLDDWVKAGGSPLLATRHDGFPAYKYPPILGYLKCLLQVPNGFGLLRAKHFKTMSLDQWRLGTDDEMVASSLLRGLCTGVINSFNLDNGIPVALFDAFKNPVIEAQVIELLKASTPTPEGNGIFENAEYALMTAYVFNRLGLYTLRQAVLESPAYTELEQPVHKLVEHMMWATLSESNHSCMTKAQQFLLHALDIEPGDPVIDQALKLRFELSHTAANREFVFESATRRMEYLIEAGALSQVGIWMTEALPYMDRFPVIPDEQKGDFIAACKIGDPLSVMEGLAIYGNPGESQSLDFMIRVLGPEGFVEAFRKTCERAVSSEAHWVKGESFNLNSLVGLNVNQLKQHGLLHEVLDCVMAVYEPLWAKKGASIQNGEKNFAVEIQFQRITKWVGKVLTAAPCNERAVAWFKRLEHPFAQEQFVAAIPASQAIFRRMSFQQRAAQFSRDLGL
ncbi:hypothetical protein [Pseudomonas serbica]|uniref:hypothetical protein n=1 Tax=Pseudomonas serbica TaxID=2965074 RepID=UPI00237C2485|nr:hypothetical protein [Pseudomonas serbica]